MPNVDQPRWLVVTILVSLLVGCTPSDSIPPAERTPETQDQAPGLIAFVSDREGAEALFVMHPDGSGVRRLTSELPAVSYPSWPADGQRIAFNAGSPTANDIYVINIDGSRPDAGGSWEFYTVLIATGATRSLTNSPGFDGQPAWQPLRSEAHGAAAANSLTSASYDRRPPRFSNRGHAVTSQPVLFIQGAGNMNEPQGSGRLAAYLARELSPHCRVIAPEMPHADSPGSQSWRDRIEQEVAAIDEQVIFIGHSFGGSVLLKYLAEGSYRTSVRGLFLLSVPNWGPDGWAYAEFAVQDDLGSRLPATKVFLYHSRDDPEVPFAHLGYYQERLPTATVRPIAGSEHSFVDGLPMLVDDINSLTL